MGTAMQNAGTQRQSAGEPVSFVQPWPPTPPKPLLLRKQGLQKDDTRPPHAAQLTPNTTISGPYFHEPHHPLVSMSTNILWQLENMGLPKARLNTKQIHQTKHFCFRPLQKAQSNPATYCTFDERKKINKYLVLASRRWVHTRQNQRVESIILPKKRKNNQYLFRI